MYDMLDYICLEEKIMEIYLYEDEYFPFYYVRPKKQSYSDSLIVDIPKDLYDRNEAIMVQFKAIQKELRAIYKEIQW